MLNGWDTVPYNNYNKLKGKFIKYKKTDGTIVKGGILIEYKNNSLHILNPVNKLTWWVGVKSIENIYTKIYTNAEYDKYIKY